MKKWIDKFNVETVLNLSKEGKNYKEIGNILDIPSRRVSDLIKCYNLDIPKRSIHKINHYYFDNIDNELKSYILGFIFADGAILKDTRSNNNITTYNRISFSNSIDDKEIIELINKELCPTVDIKYLHNTKGAKNRKIQCSLRFSSERLCRIIEKLGMVSNKTIKGLNFPDINNDLIRHFIRGFFDGDGHIGNSLDFCCSDKNFLINIGEILKKELFINYRIYEIKGKTTYYYKFYTDAKKESKIKIYNYFYNNSNYYLNRKYLKFKKLIPC